jgi:hypothetical protein
MFISNEFTPFCIDNARVIYRKKWYFFIYSYIYEHLDTYIEDKTNLWGLGCPAENPQAKLPCGLQETAASQYYYTE